MTSVPTTVQLQFFLTQIFLHLNVFCWQKKTNYAKLIKLCAAAKLCTKLCACIIPPYSCNCVRSKSLQAVVFSGVVMLVCFPKLSLWIFQNNLAVFLMPLNFGLKSRFLDHRSRRAPVTPSSECECRWSIWGWNITSYSWYSVSCFVFSGVFLLFHVSQTHHWRRVQHHTKVSVRLIIIITIIKRLTLL